ncbi:MAG: LacI family transcriptional regulator [Frankiales bacterium]|nr:LacI family transcriptional regulator [Frankiales bacterium]
MGSATGRATVRSVAADTGVSIATVSRVLNGRAHVAPETRRRVQEAVDRLNRQATRKRSERAAGGSVLVRCPYELTDYFGPIISSVAESLRLHQREVLLDAGASGYHDDVLRRLPARRDIAGAVLVLPPETKAELESLRASGVPFVVTDPRVRVPRDIFAVSAANFAGSRDASEHLIQLGHRRIGVISVDPPLSAGDDRLSGHASALAAVGALMDPSLIRYGEPTEPTGLRAGGELLDTTGRTTAIVCFNDKVAVGVLHAAAQRGIRVPEDLSVVGFDDIDVSRATTPQLTTVRQPLQEMGRMAVMSLMRLIEGHDTEALHIELATELVVRGTTAPPPRDVNRGTEGG